MNAMLPVATVFFGQLTVDIRVMSCCQAETLLQNLGNYRPRKRGGSMVQSRPSGQHRVQGEAEAFI
jgi:hypothetical protein